MYIKLFYLYRIMGQLLPVYPVYLLLFQQKGLSIAAISELLILWSLPVLFLELPSSLLADRWSRKNLMIAGRVLKGLCFAALALWDGFGGFAAGFLLWGTGGALCSGTEEAWLYDAMKARGREAGFDHVWGKSVFYYQATVGIASIAGSMVAAFSMELALWLSVASTAISATVAALLPEHNFYSRSRKNGGFREYIATLKDGASFCLKHADISTLIGFNVTVLVTAGILDEYDQLIVRSMGIPLALVGLWGFFRYGVEVLGGKAAWKIKLRLNRCGLDRPISIQFILAMGSGLLLALAAGFPVLLLLPFYALYYFLMSAGKVLFTDVLQTEIKHQGRATVQSMAAMLETPAGILIYSLFGAAGGSGKLQGAMLAVAAWLLAFAVFFRIFYQKRKGETVYEHS